MMKMSEAFDLLEEDLWGGERGGGGGGGGGGRRELVRMSLPASFVDRLGSGGGWCCG